VPRNFLPFPAIKDHQSAWIKKGENYDRRLYYSTHNHNHAGSPRVHSRALENDHDAVNEHNEHYQNREHLSYGADLRTANISERIHPQERAGHDREHHKPRQPRARADNDVLEGSGKRRSPNLTSCPITETDTISESVTEPDTATYADSDSDTDSDTATRARGDQGTK
jgi:hypothetical protein